MGHPDGEDHNHDHEMLRRTRRKMAATHSSIVEVMEARLVELEKAGKYEEYDRVRDELKASKKRVVNKGAKAKGGKAKKVRHLKKVQSKKIGKKKRNAEYSLAKKS